MKHHNRTCRVCKNKVYCGVKKHFCTAMADRRKQRLIARWQNVTLTIKPQTRLGGKHVIVYNDVKTKIYSWHMLAGKNWFRDLNLAISRDFIR